jgi:hypothetical protein
MKQNVEGQNWKKKITKNMIKKTTIKRINIVFDIKTKQNQIKMDKIKKKTI